MVRLALARWPSESAHQWRPAADARIAKRLRRALSRCSARLGFPWRFGIGAATSLQGLCKAQDAEARCKMLDPIRSHKEEDEWPWGKQVRVAKPNPATKCRRDQ